MGQKGHPVFLFGISCAPEMYLKVLCQVQQECDGAQNILDDVIVHAPTEEEHDRRFESGVKALSNCQFKMSHVKLSHVMCGRRCGLMVSAVDFGTDGPSSSPSRGTGLCSLAKYLTLTVTLFT